MIRTLLATTALATLISTGAFAQSTATPAPATAPSVQEPAPSVQPRARWRHATFAFARVLAFFALDFFSGLFLAALLERRAQDIAQAGAGIG